MPVIDHSESVAIKNEQEHSLPEPEKRLKCESKDNFVHIQSPSPTDTFTMDRSSVHENHEELEDLSETSFDYIETTIDSLRIRGTITSMTLHGCEFLYDKVQNVALLFKYVAPTGMFKNE